MTCRRSQVRVLYRPPKQKARGRRPRVFVLPGHSRRGPVRVLYCCASEALPAAETAEVQRKRGAACGRYSRAGVGAAVQIYEHAATCDVNLGNGNQRGRALIFASPRRRAQEKSASATRPTKQGVSEPNPLRGRVRIRFFFVGSVPQGVCGGVKYSRTGKERGVAIE